MLDVAWDVSPLPMSADFPRLMTAFVEALPDDAGNVRSLLGRASGWQSLEHAHLLLEPFCRVCGGKKRLQVHHKLPFSWRPDLEMVESNLITMCQPHHLLVGHLDLWASYNPLVVEWASMIREAISCRPRKGDQ